ncbi:MAG: beta-lactamase family protein [Candidatus Bathyarchaeota archaeon]|nr:beta-lactamase family protein [Candidatus Bathyarchaeota archaeon]
MNKHITIIGIVIILVLAAGAGCVVFSPAKDYTPELQTMIDTQWEQYCADKLGFEGSLTMKISSPKGNFFVTTNQNLTADTHFRAASTTKTFTAAAIILLHQQGQLQIDAKITDFIPERNVPYVPDSPEYDIPFKDQITIRQLLAHRAGVFDVSNDPIPENASAPYAGENYMTYIREGLAQPDHTFTFDELVGVVASNQLSYFPPETAFHYSNTGYSILGKIIEQVSGLSYAEFVEQHLLEPNELLNTSFPAAGTDQELPVPYADGYVWYQGELFLTTADNMSPNVAEGNVISTLNNLDKWTILLYSANAGVSVNWVEQMTNLQATGEEHLVYGLGTEYAEGLGCGHNGAHAGYLTVTRYDPQTEVSVTLFASVWNAEDLYGELEQMYDVGRSAKQILGYSEQTS